jgi:hypothetical protein
MPRAFLVPAMALTGALVLGCSDQPSPTAPEAGRPLAPAPALSVERGTTNLGFAFDDGRRVLFLGLTVDDLQAIFCTGGPFDTDEVNQLIVNRRDGSFKLQYKARVNVVIVEGAAFDESFCDEPSAVPTWTGIVRLILNDSDFDLSGPGADAAMMHLVGTVTDLSGQRYHLTAINQSIIAPEFDSPDDFEFTHANIKIKLKRIGS